MNYKIITKPTVEAITLAEARAHLKLVAFGSPLEHPDDTYVLSIITSAREWCEQYLGRALAEQTIEFALDDFPVNEIAVPMTPVSSVVSIKYIDTSDAEQTLSATVYALDDYTDPNWIVLKSDQSYPETNRSMNNVKVRITVGYAPDDVPFSIKAAMLLIIGSLYENRQQDMMGNARLSFNSLPLGVYNLIQPYRLGMGA